MISLGLGIGIWASGRGPTGFPPVFYSLDFSEAVNSGYIAAFYSI